MMGLIGGFTFIHLTFLIILLVLTITFSINKKIAKAIMTFSLVLVLVSVTLFALLNENNKIVGTYQVEGFKKFRENIKSKHSIIEDVNLRRYRNLWINLEYETVGRPNNKELMDIFVESKEFITSEIVRMELEAFNDLRIAFYFNKKDKVLDLIIKPDSYDSIWYYEDYDLNIEGIIEESNEWN